MGEVEARELRRGNSGNRPHGGPITALALPLSGQVHISLHGEHPATMPTRTSYAVRSHVAYKGSFPRPTRLLFRRSCGAKPVECAGWTAFANLE